MTKREIFDFFTREMAKIEDMDKVGSIVFSYIADFEPAMRLTVVKWDGDKQRDN